jgi:putative spermidine/putrescine transport system substrate-binding protein
MAAARVDSRRHLENEGKIRMEKHDSGITRRRLIKATGALAGVSALGGWSPAWAQSGGRVVLGTWGGDYSKLLSKNIDTPLMVPKKYEVVHDIGGDPERRAKMRAEARLPRGTSDLQGLSAAQMFEMNEAGLCLPIDYSKIPNAQYLLPQMKYPYGVGHIYSGKVILYNPKLISTPPTSFADALDPKHGNKLGIIDIQYQFTMMAAALASGGSMTNYDPGKERLLACRKAGARILPTNEAMAQALQNEEVGICIMWKARAVQWQKAGAKVETVAPKEGVPLYISGFVIPKNAPNKDGAHVWLNEMLQPSAQEAFAEDMGYNPTVTNAKIPPATEKRVGFNAEERKRLVDLDYSYLAKNDAALKEWWDKTFKG